MNPRPASSQRMLVVSPPPSKALLDLQKQGLELSASRSSSSLLAAHHISARSTPSDLDKPLPLEPFDQKRRSSSVYSTDTTITNIIQLYGGYREVDELPELPPMPPLHQPQAYRDTVAPLLVKRLSLSRTPSPRPPTPPRPRPRASISSVSLQSTSHSIPRTQKNAPSFVEFARDLQDRRKELVSPISSWSDQHRRAAYDKLFLPSAQVSSVELSPAVAQTPPLPDAMSGTISDIAVSEYLHSQQDECNTTPPSPIFDSPHQYSALHPRSQTGFSSSSRQAYRERHWSENWLEDDLRIESPVSGQLEPEANKSIQIRSDSAQREQERIMTYAALKYPGMNPENAGRKKSQRHSKRSSLQQGVNHLLRSLSIASRDDNRRRSSQTNGHRERQLAIQPTSYQTRGDQPSSTKQKRSQTEKIGHRRSRSKEIVTAYQSGQSQFVSVIAGARQKLIRRTSLSRRRKLKQSIILVGPLQRINTLNNKSMERDPEWI